MRYLHFAVLLLIAPVVVAAVAVMGVWFAMAAYAEQLALLLEGKK